MIITIFGATGMVGKHILEQALLDGHTVRAYGRNVLDLIATEERHPNLELIKGGLFDKSDVEKAIRGADLVLSAIGGNIDATDNTRSLGMKNIVAAMQQTGVQRIVAIGGMGCLQADADHIIAETEGFPEAYKFVTAEHLKALEYLKTSALDWTFVCPPNISNKAVTGNYTTQKDYPLPSMEINAGDLAHFLLTEGKANQYLHSKVAIGN